MLNSIKNKASKAKSKLKNSSLRIRSTVSLYKWKIFLVFVILSVIALIVALVLTAIKGVNINNQAVIINHTQGKIKDGSYTNQQILTGLGSNLFIVPRRKFLIYYGVQKQENDMLIDNRNYASGPIQARVEEGTKIQVQARISCKIQVDNLRNFLEDYGLDWHKYIIAKLKNLIIQKIAVTKFYNLNNTKLVSQINAELASYRSLAYPEKYPFIASVVSLKLKYPQFSEGIGTNNGTVGMQLILRQSEYTQLLNHYTQLQNKLTVNNAQLLTYSLQLGQIQGQIARYHKELEGNRQGWGNGLQTLTNVYASDNVGLRQFLWLYFQKMYNGTYNSYRF